MSCCGNDLPPGVGYSRRTFLRFGLGAAAAAAGGLRLPSVFAQDTVAAERQGKSVITIWLGGGPSQLDTWDPKPGQKTGGPFQAIDTTVRGLQFGEHLEKTAKQAHHMAILRAVTTKEAAHERGAFLMHTCFAPIPGQEFAAMGTVVAAELTRKDFPLPSFVAIQPPLIPQSSAFPEEYQAFSIGNLNDPIPNVRRPGDVSTDRQAERERLLMGQNEGFESPREGRDIEKVRTAVTKAGDLMTTPLLKAFDISKEPDGLKKEYGGRFGQNLLLARRLVQAGVKFVEVGLGGWDNHDDCFKAVENNCRNNLDPGLATLIKDLAEKNLLKDTLVLVMGEFGRTPEINGGNGRDHWCRCFSVAMAGCGIGGRVIGATDKSGMDIAQRPVTVPELFASIYKLIGIPENKEYVINTRKVKYSYGGKAVKELVG